MHGDPEMLMDILKLKALPSICLAFTYVLAFYMFTILLQQTLCNKFSYAFPSDGYYCMLEMQHCGIFPRVYIRNWCLHTF